MNSANSSPTAINAKLIAYMKWENLNIGCYKAVNYNFHNYFLPNYFIKNLSLFATCFG